MIRVLIHGVLLAVALLIPTALVTSWVLAAGHRIEALEAIHDEDAPQVAVATAAVPTTRTFSPRRRVQPPKCKYRSVFMALHQTSLIQNCKRILNPPPS